ncbi:molybdopterin molybdotransferase MoeA [Paracoccus albus]|uniref:molybdopterin molybdotransferase MoeA n=1 Tax=Paracoccus albus TaxID=3017784 RepID=UPI0022F03852|nr:gephyrin-like molybdotransferase Glp [Paracoccus albus]WBU59030.1 molybdopterin molybdotransferase MoeA [Paracoccus albus]
MITVEEALSRVLALAGPVQVEEIALQDALGRVLAAPVQSRMTQPPFNASAMDGYAIRRVDLGKDLLVVGEAGAGQPWTGTANPETAVRIFTGAPVPDGYDHVVIQEHVERQGDTIRISGENTNINMRAEGSDFKKNSEFFPRHPLTPRDLALLAAMNIGRLSVARRPKVAIIAGGDELVPPGAEPAAGQIICSNNIAVAGIARLAGADTQCLPIAADSFESLRERFNSAAGSDLIVTIGGASVGDHDLIGRITEEFGMDRAFYKIRMRPGKPLIAGRIGNSAMIGLPGNPVSSIVCAELFMRPLLRQMQGLGSEDRLRTGRLGVDIAPEGDRQHYLRASLRREVEDVVVTPSDDQDSARLAVLARADALLVRPANDPARRAGEKVEYIALD